MVVRVSGAPTVNRVSTVDLDRQIEALMVLLKVIPEIKKPPVSAGGRAKRCTPTKGRDADVRKQH